MASNTPCKVLCSFAIFFTIGLILGVVNSTNQSIFVESSSKSTPLNLSQRENSSQKSSKSIPLKFNGCKFGNLVVTWGFSLANVLSANSLIFEAATLLAVNGVLLANGLDMDMSRYFFSNSSILFSNSKTVDSSIFG